mgnify:CR=1 FL=1
MPHPDPLAVRRQEALHRLQRSRLQLMVALHQEHNDSGWSEPPQDVWSRMQPWISGGLSALPVLGSLLHAAPASSEASSEPTEQDGLTRLRGVVTRHPALSLGVAVAVGTLLWHQRRRLQRFVLTTALPELLSTLSVQAAPQLSAWLQSWLSGSFSPSGPSTPSGPATPANGPQAPTDPTPAAPQASGPYH